MSDIAAPVREGMSVDEFWERQNERNFELIHGEHVFMSPKLWGSDKYADRLRRRIEAFTEQRELGNVFVEVTFALPGADKNWIKGSRQPDVSYYEKSRIEAYDAEHDDEDDNLPLMLVPDLAVEIVSKSDKWSDVVAKAGLYLQDGVRLIWIIHRRRRFITVYTPNDPPVTLNEGDTLTGGDVLPGFTLELATFFT